jgi:hypothetical protein
MSAMKLSSTAAQFVIHEKSNGSIAGSRVESSFFARPCNANANKESRVLSFILGVPGMNHNCNIYAQRFDENRELDKSPSIVNGRGPSAIPFLLPEIGGCIVGARHYLHPSISVGPLFNMALGKPDASVKDLAPGCPTITV